MNVETYTPLAWRTAPQRGTMENYLGYVPGAGADHEYEPTEQQILDQANLMDLFHAAAGLCSEASELLEPILDGSPLDLVNLKEELGDLMWYMALANRALSWPPAIVYTWKSPEMKRRLERNHGENHLDLVVAA